MQAAIPSGAASGRDCVCRRTVRVPHCVSNSNFTTGTKLIHCSFKFSFPSPQGQRSSLQPGFPGNEFVGSRVSSDGPPAAQSLPTPESHGAAAAPGARMQGGFVRFLGNTCSMTTASSVTHDSAITDSTETTQALHSQTRNQRASRPPQRHCPASPTRRSRDQAATFSRAGDGGTARGPGRSETGDHVHRPSRAVVHV